MNLIHGFYIGEKRLSKKPQRIISLIPSQTELLYDLGLEEEVIGISKFCIHPSSWHQQKEKIGGPKQLNIDKIRSLKPDLILGNKEENIKEQIESLEGIAPVWLSDITTLEEAYDMIHQIGILVKKEEKAIEIVSVTQAKKQDFEKDSRIQSEVKSAAYLIWRKPWMAAAKGTFIDHLMQLSGFQNIFENHSRYPEVELEALVQMNPQTILLSSEPFPFQERHAQEIREAGYKGEIIFVDGEMFCWYGSRLMHTFDYFKTLIKQMQ